MTKRSKIVFTDKLFLGKNICNSAIFFVSLRSENPYGWRKANGKRLKTLNFSSPLSRGAGRGSFSLLAAAARYSHARRKILPRPLQDIRTGGANLLHAVSLPFLPRCFTFSTLVFSPFVSKDIWQSE